MEGTVFRLTTERQSCFLFLWGQFRKAGERGKSGDSNSYSILCYITAPLTCRCKTEQRDRQPAVLSASTPRQASRSPSESCGPGLGQPHAAPASLSQEFCLHPCWMNSVEVLSPLMSDVSRLGNRENSEGQDS